MINLGKVSTETKSNKAGFSDQPPVTGPSL